MQTLQIDNFWKMVKCAIEVEHPKLNRTRLSKTLAGFKSSRHNANRNAVFGLGETGRDLEHQQQQQPSTTTGLQ